MSILLDMPVLSDEDVDVATASIRELARSFGFGALDANLIAAASSEMSMNMVRHANGGHMSVHSTSNDRGLEATFTDHGPGIQNMSCALTEGYSTLPDSLGLGLSAAKRAVEYLDISSTQAKGTKVTLRHYLPPHDHCFDLGIVSMCDDDYECNGDVVMERLSGGDTQLLAVIDGMGQGINARQAANLARDAMVSSSSNNPAELTKLAHHAVLDAGIDYGFVMAIVIADANKFRFVTVGDVDCRMYSMGTSLERYDVPDRPGLLGTRQHASFSEFQIRRDKISDPVAIILASDGISPRFDFDHIPPECNAEDIAEEIFRNHRRRHGDATAAVLKVAP